MKILIYCPRLSYYTGGGEIYPLQTAKFFARLGHDATVLTVSADYLEFSDYFKNFMAENKDVHIEFLKLDKHFEDIYSVPAGADWTRWDRESLWVSRLAYQYLSQNKFDIITVHNVIDSLAVPFDCRHVLHLHGSPFEINYICKLILEKEKNLIAVSENVKRKWIDFGAYPDIKISTNAIDDSVYFEDPSQPRDIDLLFVGRLIPIKGVQHILQALKNLKEQKNFTPNFTIIGKGPYREELEALTEKLGLTDQVQFLGLVSNEVLRKSYRSAKLAVLPSYDKEGIMSTLLEAAACKTPAITTRGTSMEEFAKNDENALLVNQEDPDDLTEKIYKMLTDKEFSDRIANNAYNTIKEKFTWVAKAKELLKLYEEVSYD